MKRKEETSVKEQWTADAGDMLYLIQCGINSIVPDLERVAKMDLAKVYARSKSQSLEVLTFIALESLIQSNPGIQIPDENQVIAKWRDAKSKAVAKVLMMDAAREQLLAFLEEQGIWHVALKGIVLCHMYPKYGMRQMGDNDILFDSSFRQTVHDWFVEQGYEVESFQKLNHDVYLKKPIYNFEMHTALFQESEQPELAQYYLTIKERLIQKPGTAFEYDMKDEDFYLYIVAHEYKHYFDSGTGLRSLLDLYVCDRMKTGMDRKYLDKELNKMGLLTFENQMKELALKVFAPESMSSLHIDTLSEKEQDILTELVSNSTYGTLQKRWDSQIRKFQPDGKKISLGAKLRYLIHRIFPDRIHLEAWCHRHAPYFLRHQWIMPLAAIWRIIKSGVEIRKKIKEELDRIRKA